MINNKTTTALPALYWLSWLFSCLMKRTRPSLRISMHETSNRCCIVERLQERYGDDPFKTQRDPFSGRSTKLDKMKVLSSFVASTKQDLTTSWVSSNQSTIATHHMEQRFGLLKKEQDDNDFWMRHLAWDLCLHGYAQGEATVSFASCTASYLRLALFGYDMAKGCCWKYSAMLKLQKWRCRRTTKLQSTQQWLLRNTPLWMTVGEQWTDWR